MLYFFGDSWPAEGGELERIYEKKFKSYPAMISDILDIPYINHAQSGTSQMDMILKLISSKASTGDHAIFSMTASSRRFYFDDNGTTKNTSVDQSPEQVNDYQDSWLSALSCYTILNYCAAKQIHAWFINTFNVSYKSKWAHPLWNMIPDNPWILPKDTCVVQMLFDPKQFSHGYDDSDFYDWLQSNNAQVQQYIRPCLDHPNLTGRQRIAQVIAEKIKKELQ
jgi:hypothetical protein